MAHRLRYVGDLAGRETRPVPTPAQTVADLAHMLTAEEAVEIAVDDLITAQLMAVDRLRQEIWSIAEDESASKLEILIRIERTVKAFAVPLPTVSLTASFRLVPDQDFETHELRQGAILAIVQKAPSRGWYWRLVGPGLGHLAATGGHVGSRTAAMTTCLRFLAQLA